MPSPPPAVVAACRGWFATPPRVLRALDGSGFSGSPVWLVEDPGPEGGRYVLKAFAADASLERARAVHRLVRRASAAGIRALPPHRPLRAPGAGTILADGSGRLWEMAEWRPGEPVQRPSAAQARAALLLLARLHHAIADVDLDGAGTGHARPAAADGPPPAWERRRSALEAVAVRGWSAMAAPRRGAAVTALDEAVAGCRADAAACLARHGGGRLLARLAAVPVPSVALQAVLRDVWQAHLLFEGDSVSGLIDVHAAGIDTPATDLARLLGSWHPPAGADAGAGLRAMWGEALAAYESVRPLSPAERALVDLLHVAGTVGSLEHWFTWVLEEQREFHSPWAVVERVRFLTENLDSALQRAESVLGEAD